MLNFRKFLIPGLLVLSLFFLAAIGYAQNEEIPTGTTSLVDEIPIGTTTAIGCNSISKCIGQATSNFALRLKGYSPERALVALQRQPAPAAVPAPATVSPTSVSASIPIPTTLKAEFDREVLLSGKGFVFNLDWDVPKGNGDLGFEVEVKVLDDKYSGPNFQVSFLKNEPGLYDSSISGNNTLKVWVALPDAMKLYKSYEFKVRSIRGTSASNYSSPVTVNGR